MADQVPPLTLTLEWEGDLRFRGRSKDAEIVLDSEGRQGPSPVQALAFGLAGCMGMDVVHILEKARQPVEKLRIELAAWRAPVEPRRVTVVTLRFVVTGEVVSAQIERAIQLSHDKYCSVWHSMRQDIDFRTEYEVEAGEVSAANAGTGGRGTGEPGE